MKPEIAEGVVSNTVSGVARHGLFVVSSGVGLAWTGFSHVLSPPPIEDSDKASVSLTGSSPAYPVARQTPFTPPLNPMAGQNGAQFLSFKKITPLSLTVRRTTMPEVGLTFLNKPHSHSPDFRLTRYAEVRT